jgi:hypothetical protein
MKGKLLNTAARLVLFTGILLALFMPLIQDTTHFKSWIKPLQGAFIPAEDVSFSWRNWFNGSYQEEKNKFLKENFGLHNYYIFLNSQLDYWLFKKAHVKNVIVGQHNYFFETPYISAYYGRDFMGKPKADALAARLRKVQDTLDMQNKLVLVVFTAGKASYYPEYIPPAFHSGKKITNYEYLLQKMKELKLHHIDFNSWFVSQKHKSRYPLYPQFGIHWSSYGSMLAFDSIIKYSEFRTKADLPELICDKIEVSDSLRAPDNDILNAMNLYFQPSTFKMAYPEYHVEYDSARHRKLKLLVVGDSFWWQIYGSGLTGKLFSQSRFWYYNIEMYPESYFSVKHVYNSDYETAIKESDVIILMYSEANLSKFGNGFIEMLYETYFEPGKRAIEINAMKKTIRSSPEWYSSIRQEAVVNGLSVDSMLTLNAIYTLQMNKNQPANN